VGDSPDLVLAKNLFNLHVSESIIKLIWTHCYDEWINRNNALHGHNQQTMTHARITTAHYKIRALYSLRHHCSHLAHREWFCKSLEAHFTRQLDPQQLENWIASKLESINNIRERASEALKSTFHPSPNPAPLLALLYPQFTLENFVCLLHLYRPAHS
jgi:superoxide dismutase